MSTVVRLVASSHAAFHLAELVDGFYETLCGRRSPKSICMASPGSATCPDCLRAEARGGHRATTLATYYRLAIRQGRVAVEALAAYDRLLWTVQCATKPVEIGKQRSPLLTARGVAVAALVELTRLLRALVDRHPAWEHEFPEAWSAPLDLTMLCQRLEMGVLSSHDLEGEGGLGALKSLRDLLGTIEATAREEVAA